MEEMLTSKQVRQIFNVTNQTLFNWRKSGKLPYTDIGTRGYLYKRSDIINILGLKEEKANECISYLTEEPKEEIIEMKVPEVREDPKPEVKEENSEKIQEKPTEKGLFEVLLDIFLKLFKK